MTATATAEIAAPAPSAALPLVKCAECGNLFVPSRRGQRYCPTPGAKVSACAKAANNRNIVRGGPVVPIAMAWHATRHAKPGTREAEINRYARRELTAIMRTFNQEDAEAGRASAVELVGALMDAKSIYADRVRR